MSTKKTTQSKKFNKSKLCGVEESRVENETENLTEKPKTNRSLNAVEALLCLDKVKIVVSRKRLLNSCIVYEG